MSQYLDKDGASRIAENFLSKQAEQNAILQNLQFDLKEAEHALVKTIQGPAPLNIRALTRPLDDYRISGNTIQNGTPTPSDPVDAVGCGERTGNLFGGFDYYGVVPSINNGRNANYNAGASTDYIKVDNPLITLSKDESFKTVRIYIFLYDDNKTFIGYTLSDSKKITSWTISNYTSAKFARIRVDSYYQYAEQYMLNLGSEVLPYEPYGYRLDMSSGGRNLWNYTIEQGGWDAAPGTIPTPFQPSSTNYPIRCRVPYMIPIPSNTMSLTCPSNIKINFVWIDANGVSMGGSGWRQSGSTVTAPENAITMTFILAKVDDSYCSSNDFQNIMLNSGSIALPYEPYNRTTTPIYLGQVPTTRRIRKLVLTGDENWNLGQNYTYYNTDITDYLRSSDIPISICSHYKSQAPVLGTSFVSDMSLSFYKTAEYSRIYIRDTSLTTVAAFKSYLAAQYANGTPVTVWYVLVEPETGIVNEPLHKIGDYADTVSMAQAGVEISTTKGFNTITTDTTVLPSIIEVKGVINNA